MTASMKMGEAAIVFIIYIWSDILKLAITAVWHATVQIQINAWPVMLWTKELLAVHIDAHVILIILMMDQIHNASHAIHFAMAAQL
jgi:hypothetical protein